MRSRSVIYPPNIPNRGCQCSPAADRRVQSLSSGGFSADAFEIECRQRRDRCDHSPMAHIGAAELCLGRKTIYMHSGHGNVSRALSVFAERGNMTFNNDKKTGPATYVGSARLSMSSANCPACTADSEHPRFKIFRHTIFHGKPQAVLHTQSVIWSAFPPPRLRVRLRHSR